jgi:serine/threonine protein kinase
MGAFWMNDRVGQQLGNYQLIRLLGEGGFAEVYLGKHIHLGTQAAIKVLNAQLTKDDMENFRNEARTIARLEHPHIVRVLDFGVEGNTPFLVMSYAANGTLRQLHPNGTRLSLETIVTYVNQVTDALQYAHDEKLVHRDIKPENMLLGRHREILLSDFGIAVMAQSSRSQHAQDLAGTINYMAPEQIQGKPRTTSDQYSLAIVIYEWLTGTLPFHGSLTEMVGQHLSVSPPPLRQKLPGISPAVEAAVMKALAKDPKERFARVKDFATALEQAILSAQQSQSNVILPPVNQPLSFSNQAVTLPGQSLQPGSLSQVHKTKDQWLSEALVLLEADRYTEALAAFNYVLSLDPNHAYAHSGKGLALYHLKRYAEALSALERALALNPHDTSARYGRGLALEQLKRYADALLAYESVTQLNASFALAWRKKGNVLCELKRYEEAIAAYERALQLDRNDADAYIGKGNALKHLGGFK